MNATAIKRIIDRNIEVNEILSKCARDIGDVYRGALINSVGHLQSVVLYRITEEFSSKDIRNSVYYAIKSIMMSGEMSVAKRFAISLWMAALPILPVPQAKAVASIGIGWGGWVVRPRFLTFRRFYVL